MYIYIYIHTHIYYQAWAELKALNVTEDSHLIKLDDTALASLTVAPAAKDKIKSLAAQEAAWQDEANRNASLMQVLVASGLHKTYDAWR